MKRKTLVFSISMLLVIGVLAGFSYYDESPNSSRIVDIPLKSVSPVEKKIQAPFITDANPVKNDAIIYTDNFDGPNDTISLKNRGYKVYYRGSVAQGISTWFQGVPANFPAFNGPTNGYVAANYQVIANPPGLGNIDSWLVLPKLNIGSNDSLYFVSRAFTGSTFPDSVRVMYSAAGDSVPEASWTELGRFKVNTGGVWELKGFRPSSAGANARYAIRYNVVNGGFNGVNSDYIGIDALTVGGQPPPPPLDIVEVSNVYALGKKPMICYDTNTIRVRLVHQRAQTDTVNVNIKVKNNGGVVKSDISGTVIMTGIGAAVLSTNYIKPDSLKADSIIATATANGEQNTANNRATYLSFNTPNAYNYAIPTDPVDGGVGFTGGSGDFVAKFYTNCTLPLYAVDLTFSAFTGGGNQPYNVLIFADAGGVPAAVPMFTSGPLVSPPGDDNNPQLFTYNLPAPVNVTGTFYVGIAQTSTVNIAFGFQNESPIRSGSFYYRAPTTWTDFSPGADFRLDICPRTSLNLNLTVLIEGFWNAPTNTGDTITVQLRNATTPYGLVTSAKAKNNSSGNLSVSLNAPGNVPYYLAIRQRNSIETWSKFAQPWAPNPLSYDFTSSASQAFGNNMVLKGGKYTLFSGDVNQDGAVTAPDISLVDNDAFLFATGYIPTDVNGDNATNAIDLGITDNNAFNFVSKMTP